MTSNRTYLSGATKRKLKREKDEALARTNASITAFLHGTKKKKGEDHQDIETGILASEVLGGGVSDTQSEPGPNGGQPEPDERGTQPQPNPQPGGSGSGDKPQPHPQPGGSGSGDKPQPNPQPGGSGIGDKPQPSPQPGGSGSGDKPEPEPGDHQFRNPGDGDGDSGEGSCLSDNDGDGERANGVFRGLNVCSFVCPNPGDPVSVKIAFWKQHTIQVKELKNGQALPFDHTKLYYRTLPSGEKIQRKWLSYSENLNKVFCSSCMAFGDKNHRDSTFVVGHDVSPKHIYKAVESHENARSHHDAVTAALQACGGKSIEALIDSNLANERMKQVEVRRQVVQRLIDIVLFIGRQGLAFRGKDEAAFSLESKGNHGNFLELVLLMAEYDIVLKTHVKQCIAASKERKKKGKIGRGSLLTFLSKTFINKLIKTIARVGLEILVENIKQAGKYSLMVDTTSDVAAMNQVAICIRYVHQGQVQERLLQMATVDESTGENLYELVSNELNDVGISVSNMSGCSFDGASNMSSEYKSLQARLKEMNPSLIFTHCMGHCLNLVVCDCTTNSNLSENLFGLVGESASFLNRSYKRMSVWTKTVKEKHSAHGKLRKLKTIGATRWWSKHKALTSIIDFNEEFGPDCKFCTFLSVLIELSNSTTDCNTKFLARTLIEKWTKFDTIMAAMIMCDLFDVTSPVSVLLQSKNLDYLKAFAMVETLLTQISQKRDEGKFRLLYEKCVAFTKSIETVFGDKIDSIETDFAVRGTGRRSESSYDKVKIGYYEILDWVSQSIKERFVPNKDLIRDCYWLDPRNFKEVSEMDKSDFPEDAFVKLAQLAMVDRDLLFLELKQFAGQFNSFKTTWKDQYSKGVPSQTQTVSSSSDSDSETETGNAKDCGKSKDLKNDKCFNCLSCAFSILFEISGQSGLFGNLYTAFKYVLTLPCTQVTCERVFSKLKILKNRLRSTMTQDILFPLLLMFIERDLYENLDKEKIVNLIAMSSTELKSKLLR